MTFESIWYDREVLKLTMLKYASSYAYREETMGGREGESSLLLWRGNVKD
jgi:hypothetical protein